MKLEHIPLKKIAKQRLVVHNCMDYLLNAESETSDITDNVTTFVLNKNVDKSFVQTFGKEIDLSYLTLDVPYKAMFISQIRTDKSKAYMSSSRDLDKRSFTEKLHTYYKKHGDIHLNMLFTYIETEPTMIVTADCYQVSKVVFRCRELPRYKKLPWLELQQPVPTDPVLHLSTLSNGYSDVNISIYILDEYYET